MYAFGESFTADADALLAEVQEDASLGKETEVKFTGASGTLDSGLEWSLTAAGMLSVSGNGDMDNFTLSGTPWEEHKDLIRFVYLSDGITSIGDYAFAGLSAVNSVYIPAGVTLIGASAFEGCGELKEIVLPKNLKTIGANAFASCSTLKTVSIPQSVDSIGITAFSNCSSLKKITVEKRNENYADDAGVLYTADFKTLVSYPTGKMESLYKIPEGVTTIGGYAFAYCSNLEEIKFPSTLEKISDGAFYECNSIQKMNIPASVTEIAQSAFAEGCTSLAEINVDEDNNVFSSESGVLFNKEKTKLLRFPANCESACFDGFYTIPLSVKVIGQEAFWDCRTVTTLSIPGNLERIEMAAFMYFDSLNEIWFDGTEINWKMVEKDVFNELLDVVPVLCMEGTLDERVFQAKVGVTYYLEDFVDLQGNEDVLETLVVSSSDTNVATVDTRKMTALSEGEAIISAVATKDGVTYAVAVKVVVTADGSANNKDGFTLVEGDTTDLKDALDVPEEFLESLVWTSSNPKVATVEDGFLTAVSEGKAIIMASVDEEATLAYSIRCEITVERKYTDESYFEFNNGTIEKYIGPDSEVDIPPTIGGVKVTGIGSRAFEDCAHVTKIEMPETITMIYSRAFKGCTSLSNISLHEGITYIGNYSFENCTSLIKITIPSTATDAASGWFTGCTRLNTVVLAEGTKGINRGLQYGPFKYIQIPASVTTINYNAFDGCSNLTSITIPKSVTYIGNYAFRQCSKLSVITIPGNVTSIGNYAFQGCTELKQVTLNEGLKTIGNYLFYGCKALRSIVIPDSVISMGTSVFSDCSNLEEVTIGGGIQFINNGFFSGCTSIKKVILSEGITEIRRAAFYQCSGLESIIIPDSVTYIGNEAFYDCSNLKHAEFGSGLETIGYRAFYKCTSLDSIKIPDGVTYIGDSAFYSCTNLKQVEFGSALNTIAGNAFAYCTKLESITIPDTVTTIGSSAFLNCTSLKQIDLGSGLKAIKSGIFKYCTKLESIKIPDSVTTIDDNAFYGCTNLKQVDLGSGLKTINNYAFYNCSALESIKIPDRVTSIGLDAFYNCKNLSQVELGSGLRTIGGAAFYNCENLESIRIPDSVTSIGVNAFSRCYTLNEVCLGSGLQAIDSSTFYYCTNLKSIEIPDQVTSIGTYAFYYCTALEQVELGSGLLYINDHAFSYCTKLESIKIPENVLAIYDYAFSCCKKLSDVSIGNPSCGFGYNVFYGCDKLQTSANFTASYNALSEESVGYFPMQLTYEIKDSGFSTDKKITVSLPQNAYLVPGTMKLNGEAYSNYVEEEREYYYNRVVISLEKGSGTLTFTIKPTEYGNFSTNAELSMKNLGKTVVKQIGQVFLSMPDITINAADTTGRPDVVVEGTAIPNQEIVLSVDGVAQKTIRSNYGATYKTTVQIENPEDYRDYKITAEIVNYSGETVAAETTVQYRSDTPDLDNLTFYYGKIGGYKTAYVLYGAESQVTRPIILWGDYITRRTDTYNYTFSVNLSHPEAVDKVYVVSTRDNKKEYLEAKWNSQTERYETSGYFAGSHAYMPGVLTVEYTKLSDGSRASFSDIGAYLGFENDAFTPSITDYTGTFFCAEVAVSEALQEIFGNNIIIASEIIDRDYTDVSTEALYANDVNYYSYVLTTETGDECVVNFDLTDAAYLCIDVHNLTQGYQMTYKMAFTSENEEGVESDIPVTEVLGKANEYAGKLLNAYNLNFDLQALTDGLNLAGLDAEQMALSLKIADELELKKQLFVTTALALSVSSMEGVSAPFDVLDVILDSIEEDVAYFRNLRLLNIFKIGSECKVRWKIDPSGYVYEGVTDNRLEGVTTTAYFVEHENVPKKPDGSADVENINPSDIKLWDASEYDQMNPIITGADGMYQWDVPEGYWQIKYEKDGYETTYSEWLPVLPAQTDVNISLVSKAVPKVEKVYLTTDYLVVTFDKYMDPATINQVSVGDVGYTLDYDDSKTDADGNVFAKEFTFIFDSALRPGMDYTIEVSDAKSYADVAMEAYTTTVKTPGEPLPTVLTITDVSEETDTISATYTNYAFRTLSYSAICASYDEEGRLVELKMAMVDDLEPGKEVTKEFTLSLPYSSYRLFTWSTNGQLMPIIELYDSLNAVKAQ